MDAVFEAGATPASAAVISRLDGPRLLSLVDESADLLTAAVNSGASIGFLAPLDRAAVARWNERSRRCRPMGSPSGWRVRGPGWSARSASSSRTSPTAATLLHLDTETDSPAEHLYLKAGRTRIGTIPDCAADPYGTLRPTSVCYERVGNGTTG